MSKDALATGSEWRKRTRDLIPSSQIGLELESGVAGRVIALAVPQGWYDVGAGLGVVAVSSSGNHRGGVKDGLRTHVVSVV